MKRTAIALAVSTLLSTVAAAQTAEEIMQRVYDRDQGDTARSVTEMVLSNGGEVTERRLYELWVLEDDEDTVRTFTEFHEPASIQGTRFLTVERDGDDDLWTYLPGLRRVRRIGSSDKTAAFVGSEFTYNDMERREVELDVHSRLREERWNGYDTWVVESEARDPSLVAWARVVTWIDQGTYTPVRRDFYDARGRVFKMYTVERMEAVQGIATVIVSRMENLETGRATELRVGRLQYNRPIDENRFTTRFLERGR